jgi:DNA polymerase III subunit gamma/tau
MQDSPGTNAAGYRVLARKYRPKTFTDLIGQDALVRTLTNAFATGRIAQAYMLTGVRGVGKTTTARLIARALNYPSGPTVDMNEITEQCEAILESRHMDVIEMDAASNTGVDNMREIIDSVRYAPVSVRTKVYIIDEVHMLSKSAFNALLKTLEEPPEHVKFIFATTEIRKVPVTILSRCQRFDLKRLDGAMLAQHYGSIAECEQVEAETEALVMIARAAEGSVRDGLSLLDQAIAYGNGAVRTADVSNMLGLVDRSKVIDLFEAVMGGDAAGALGQLKIQHDGGGDPETILTDLANFVHWVTRLKVARDSALLDGLRSQDEKTRGVAFAEQLTIPNLTRAWQILLKGISETAVAAHPLAAMEMVIIRLVYGVTLPSGDDLLRLARKRGEGDHREKPVVLAREFRKDVAEASAGPALSMALAVDNPPNQTIPALTTARKFQDIITLATDKRDIKLKSELERFVRPIKVSDGKIELALEPDAPAGLPGELSRKLEAWTGRRWMVMVAKAGGAEPLAHTKKASRDRGLRAARENPDVQAILQRFPGAEIIDVRESDTVNNPEENDEESV